MEDSMGENWFSYSTLYSEMVKLYPSGSHFLEIGCWKGKSSAYMAVEILNSEKNIRFDCIDIWETSDFYKTKLKDQLYPEFDFNLFETFCNNTRKVSHVINIVRLDSISASKAYQNNSIDFIFIDADHSYDAVKSDLKNWLPKIKDGGIIAGHDYGYDPVNKAVSDLFGKNDFNDPWKCGCFLLKVKTNYDKVLRLKQLFDQGRYLPQNNEELEKLKNNYMELVDYKITNFSEDKV